MVTSMNVTRVKAILWPQWLAAIDVFLLSVVMGLVGGWTSPYLAKLTHPESELLVTEEDASWIAAILSLGRIAGAMIGAVAVEYCGSKKATLFTGLPTAVAWILFTVADSVALLFLARTLCGFGVGMYFSTFPMYMGEISSPKIRGTLVSVIAQGMPFGTLLGNLIGAFTPMWIFSCFSLVPNLAFLALFSLMPDSPHFLICQERVDDAKKSLEWYNRDVDATPELEALQKFVALKKTVSYSGMIRQLFANSKAVVVVSIVVMFVQVSGLWTTTFYMEIILTNAGVTVIDPSLVVVIVGLSGMVFGWASMYANDKCGRKFMLASSSFGIAVAYLLMGIDYQLLEFNIKPAFVTQWLPIIGLLCFQCSMCIGIVPVPSILMSEMFSPDIKSTASCLANICSAVFAFISSKTYQPLITLTAEQYVFWLYGILMCGLGIYSLVCLPETKGKTLPEIQKMLMEKQPKSKASKSQA